jgi:hypothetical protein
MWVEHHLFANCQIQVKGRSTVSVLRKPLMLEARGLTCCLPVRIELLLKGILPVFQALTLQNMTLFKVAIFKLMEKAQFLL